MTRLNAYSGMAGFYVIRDDFDTGEPDNPLTLPVYPFEAALVIQDKMFKPNGELFYPAFPGDPAYADFITGEGAGEPPYPPVPNPSVLAEFFGYVNVCICVGSCCFWAQLIRVSITMLTIINVLSLSPQRLYARQWQDLAQDGSHASTLPVALVEWL